MTWLEALVKVVGSLAWPLTLVVLVAIFRPELNAILKGVTKIDILGASIDVRLDKLQSDLPKSEPDQLQAFPSAELAETALIRSGDDPRSALMRVEFALEQELFRPSELGLSPRIETSTTTSRRIDQLVDARILDEAIAHSIREFLGLVSEVTHATRRYSEKELRRAVEVGARLVAEVRRQIVSAELEHHFQSNLLWHHAQHPEASGEIRSAVAASAPDFEYDYDLYRETVQTFNRNEATRAAAGSFDAIEMKSLTLEEFVEVLEFREREIMRVLEEKRKSKEDWKRENLEWKWPQEWGDVHWNGPVLRDKRPASFDLEKLRRALEKYRRRLNK